MRRVMRAVSIFVGCCVLALGGYGLSRLPRYSTRLTRGGTGIARKLPPANYWRGELTALPAHTPGGREPFEVDLRGYDLSALDLTSRLDDLSWADFDSKTRWPEELPAGFDPATIMELGKDPGLGVRALHRKGITGKGVGLAIIDQGLLVDHVEYAGRLKLYEEIHSLDGQAQMHGPAVASIAVGRSVGVAPEADLYYIAETHAKHYVKMMLRGGARDRAALLALLDFKVTAKSIRRLLEINRSLPDDKKIRVISISVGWSPGSGVTGYDAVRAAVEEAKEEGVFVVSTALRYDYGLSFHGLGRDPTGDANDLSAYTASSWDEYYLDEHRESAPLFVPMDSRTTASPTGQADYAFYREGGWSWCVPYIAGLYALACQVKPDITPEEFWAKAVETGDTIEVASRPDAQGQKHRIGRIVNPQRLIESLQE